MSEYLSRDQILGADDLPGEDITVPEWPGADGKPGTVRIRGLTGMERDRFDFKMAAANEQPDKAQVRAEIVARCVIDDEGKRIFTDKDVKALGAKSGAVLDRLFDVVSEKSGIGQKARQKAEKDFSDAPSESSSSD